MKAERVTDPYAYHGEGPVWYPPWGGLRWVDMLAGDVLTLRDETGRVDRSHVGTVAAAVRPRAGGGMVVAIERGFALVDPDGRVRDLGELWSDSGTRMNDGGCDPDGRFYCGSMSGRTGEAALYRLDTDGTVRSVLAGVTVSNGLAWGPDGASAYYVDSQTQRVDAFDYDPVAGLTGRREVVRIPELLGTPDGLTVDADGYVWVALWGGGVVRRYAPDGRLDGAVEVPVSQVSSCAFGGSDLTDLYITTSRQDLPADAEPDAGSVYRYRTGVTGLPVLPFAG